MCLDNDLVHHHVFSGSSRKFIRWEKTSEKNRLFKTIWSHRSIPKGELENRLNFFKQLMLALVKHSHGTQQSHFQHTEPEDQHRAVWGKVPLVYVV